MVTYHNLSIIGTSHIAKESIQKVKDEIEKINPTIVACELDSSRLKALFSRSRENSFSILKKLGIRAFIFNVIGAYIERSLGKYTGVKPGSEMKIAITWARENKRKIFLIDQPIEITLEKLTKQLTRKEKVTFLKDILKIPFTKKEIIFDLNKIPPQKTINKLIRETKKKYPTVYKILIQERNEHMAKALSKLMNMYPGEKIVAIVGAGHEKEIITHIKWMKN